MKAQNMLVILSDEHNPHVMGCAGHPLAKTPNLDRLAAGGTRFSAAYTNSPICVPARASLATGMHVHEHRYWDNAMAYDGRLQSWGHALQRNGHRVDAIGKLHYRAPEDPVGFDHQINTIHLEGGIGQVWGSLREPPLVTPDRAAKMLQPIGPGTSSYNRYDRQNTEHACRWLVDAASHEDDKPWVLYVGLTAPHFPLTVPQEYLDLYPPEAIPEPRLHPSRGYQRHPWVERFHQCQPVDDSLNDEGRRMATACYLALCSYMDAQVGKILETLESTGLADSTRVIYASDHGDNLGTRGLWGKCTMYEEAAGVPLILSGQGVPQGKISNTAVSLLDVYQTVLQTVGEEEELRKSSLCGRSLLEIAREEDDIERVVLSQYHALGSETGVFMLRQGQYKYIHYVGHEPELFDLEQDPGEECNLAAVQPDRVEALEALLRSILDPEAVDRLAKADQAVLIERFGGPEKARNLGPKGASSVLA